MRRLKCIAQILKVNAGCAPGHKKSVDGVGGVSWVEKAYRLRALESFVCLIHHARMAPELASLQFEQYVFSFE
jgi:hypothetical protein